VNSAAFAQAADIAGKPGAAWLSWYDTAAQRWVPVRSQYNPGTRMVTAQVAHLSTWNPFTWDWAGMFLRLRQMLSAFGVGRAPSVNCPKTQGVNVTMVGGNDPPLIGCVTSETASGLEVNITSNRSYTMVLQAPPAAVQQPRDYAGFEEYLQTSKLAANVIGGAYLGSVQTVTYNLPAAPAGRDRCRRRQASPALEPRHPRGAAGA
jgi:hypothetical protein